MGLALKDCNGQYKPDTLLDSLPIKIPLNCSGDWWPNFG
jgi:hypothetical protein